MPARTDAALRSRAWRTAAIAVLIAALLVFQCSDIGWLHLQAWDESRLAVNAIEMMLSGDRLVTTYGFHPDLWNTKPPLAINLMAGSMALFGPTAFAARLPAALAACATVIVLGRFVARITGSPGCGVGAAALLATAPLFHGYHSGQTADYDAILTLFTTGYAIALFDLIEADRRAPATALAAGALTGLAILTKGVAGIIPGIGIAAYAVIFAWQSLGRKTLDYAIVVGVAAVIGGAFYLLRANGPAGYMAAMAANDLGGRFGTALDQHIGSRWFYLREIVRHPPGWALPAIAALPLLGPGPARRLALFALCQVAGIVVVYSSAATKISWYIVPALPFVATLIALAGLALTRRAAASSPRAAQVASTVMALVVAAFAAQAVRSRYIRPWSPPALARPFDTLIAAATVRRMTPLVVVDTGYANGAGFVDYAPTLRFYALAASTRGIVIRQAVSVAHAADARFAGSCDPATRAEVVRLAPPVWSGDGCVLIDRSRR